MDVPVSLFPVCELLNLTVPVRAVLPQLSGTVNVNRIYRSTSVQPPWDSSLADMEEVAVHRHRIHDLNIFPFFAYHSS